MIWCIYDSIVDHPFAQQARMMMQAVSSLARSALQGGCTIKTGRRVSSFTPRPKMNYGLWRLTERAD